MPKARDDDLCEYELERIAKINRNLDFLEQLGIEVDRSAYFPKKPSKRKSKVESDSSSDEEWRPGKDEYNRKKFKPFKPVFKPMKTGHTIAKRNFKIGTSESKSNHEHLPSTSQPQPCTSQAQHCTSQAQPFTSQAQPSTSQAQTCTFQPTDDQDCSDFEFLGRIAEDEAFFDELENVAPEPKKRSIKFKCKRVADKPTRRSSRQKVRKNYAEEEVPDDDHYIYCDQCDDFYYGECPTHNFNIIQDNAKETDKKSPDAMKSLPENLSVKHSFIPEAGMGIFAKEKMEVNTRFGPYRGVKVPKENLEGGKNTSYMWEIVQEGKIQFYIDGQDPCQSNWMRFVNCARCEDEQNIIAYQYHGEIYYRVYKEIEAGAELLVWYGDEYAEQLGIPLFEEDEKQERKSFEVGGHTCHHCGRMYTYVSFLETHLKRCPMLICTKLWECPHCSRKYSSEDYLNVHVNNNCEKNPQGKYVRKELVYRGNTKHLGHQEHVSRQAFKDTGVVKIHQNNRGKDGAFICKECGRTYEHRGNFQYHLKTHTGERPWQCQYCEKTFTTQCSLKRHERTHTGERPYQCEHCGKTFTQSSNLKTHERVHNSARPFQCQHCGKTFTDQSNLKKHAKTHKGERPYQCQHCGKSFTLQHNLKTHERVHTGERPFQCQHCGKSFTQSSSLNTHLKTHK